MNAPVPKGSVPASGLPRQRAEEIIGSPPGHWFASDTLQMARDLLSALDEIERLREALRQVEQDIDAVPEYQLNPRTEEEVRSALAEVPEHSRIGGGDGLHE